MRTLGHNLVQITLLAIDLVPGAWVRGERYRRLRRRLSRTPERYVDKAPALPFTPGGWRERGLAGPETDLVVDGFPGSANTFLSNAIRAAVGRPVRIESHFHYRVQLERAIAHGVPALVVIRRPRDACDSLKAKVPATWDWLLVLRWLLYHRYVERRRAELDLLLFDNVVRDIDAVRRQVAAVGHLVDRPLQADERYRRPTTDPHPIDTRRAVVRNLLRHANARYRRLRAQPSKV